MKTRFKYNLMGLIGKLDDKVFYYHPRANEIMVRSFTKAVRNPPAERMKAVMANLKTLNPSEGYKQNFKDYIGRYNNLKSNRGKLAFTWMNLYLKVMFGMCKVIPGIDLATLTRQQIFEQNLPCRNLKAAIDWELLPEVSGYEAYTNPI